jgi:hypothetical protein
MISPFGRDDSQLPPWFRFSRWSCLSEFSVQKSGPDRSDSADEFSTVVSHAINSLTGSPVVMAVGLPLESS